VCGIAGVVDLGGRELFDPDRAIDALRHRGPDSAGTFIRPGACLVQTRLAVIDLVTGDPPIANEDDTVGVAFNGELYNFRALQDELRAAGHELKTAGDTEVIVHLAEDLAPVDVARRLDGMFAFAVWDDRRRRLVLGRDRFGKKPLYYWTDGKRLVFGSEIKAVLADPAVPRRLEPSALPAYLAFGYVPTPRTFYEGIRSVPPGHVLTFDSGGVRIERYWRLGAPGLDGDAMLDIDGEELRYLVRRKLCDAVDRRLIADVPLGAFLSGGVDSSAVVALMARLSSGPVRTFTIGFEDDSFFDERPYAARVAELYNTDHTEFVVNPDKADLIDRLVWHHDQPFGDSSALPTFLLSELTRQHVTVALCGDGGDEVFAGYERLAAAIAIGRAAQGPSWLTGALAQTAQRLPASVLPGPAASVQRALSRLGMNAPDAHLSWLSYVSAEWQERLLYTHDDWARRDYQRIWDDTDGADLLHRLQLLNIETYLVDDLLPKVDRMAMAHGLEVRSPLLDHELAELALRIPPHQHVRGMSLKRVLRDAARDLLPPDILHRRKHGFGVPLDRWFRTDLAAYVQGRLCSRDARVRHHLRPEAVDALVAEHQTGAADHGHALWTLLTLESFLRQSDW